MRVLATAPCRIDLAGGTLDLWPLHCLLARAATVNVAISACAEVEVELSSDAEYSIASQDLGVKAQGTFQEVANNSSLPLLGHILGTLWKSDWQPLRIKTSAKSPAGAGLGGSSALAIATCGALARVRQELHGFAPLGDALLVKTAQDIEARIIRAPTGVQDYWAAVRGNLNVITYSPGFERVQTEVSTDVPHLAEELVLCYSGKSRASADNNWKIFRRAFDGDDNFLTMLDEIGFVATNCAEAFLAGDYHRGLMHSNSEWQLRRKLWPNIETDETKRLESAAVGAGAHFSRVCGAGGGGVMALFCNPDKREDVCRALTDAGGAILNDRPTTTGLEVKVV